jgi:hypothetical protein
MPELEDVWDPSALLAFVDAGRGHEVALRVIMVGTPDLPGKESVGTNATMATRDQPASCRVTFLP